MTKYSAVVFDLDGTIIDSQLGIAKAFKHALAQYGIEEELEVIKGLIGPPLSRTIITKYGFSEEDGAKAMSYHREYYVEKGLYESRLFSDVINMLETLKEIGIVMMIATNKPEEHAIAGLKHYKLDKYFKSIIGNNLQQTRGTKADFITMAMDEAKIKDKDKVLMVGDRKHDIEGGKINNIDTIGVTYGYGTREEIEKCKPTYIVNNPMEIIKIIKA